MWALQKQTLKTVEIIEKRDWLVLMIFTPVLVLFTVEAALVLCGADGSVDTVGKVVSFDVRLIAVVEGGGVG